MATTSIFHLEPFDRFLHRVVELNRLYNPEDPVHEALLSPWEDPDGDARKAVAAAPTPAVDARRRLAAIHHDFPYGAPLAEQAAYLVRAFAGLAPFAEANHRTGWDYLAELLLHGGHELMAGPEECRSLGVELWDLLQEAYPGGLQRHQVLERDAVFDHLVAWLRPRLT